MITLRCVFPLMGARWGSTRSGASIVMVMVIGMVTRPTGISVFVIDGVMRNIPPGTISRGLGPCVAADFARLAPWLVLVMPRALGYM